MISQAMPIRTLEAIDAEIARLELDASAQGEAVSWQDARISSDEFDGGSYSDRHAREMDAKNAVHNGTAIRAARRNRREMSAAREEMRAAIRELRFERRLWTSAVPVGMLEIARLLGYSDVAARQWRHRNVLPAPAGSVSGTPYWWRADVLRWALENGRTRVIVDLDVNDSDRNEYPDVWSELEQQEA